MTIIENLVLVLLYKFKKPIFSRFIAMSDKILSSKIEIKLVF